MPCTPDTPPQTGRECIIGVDLGGTKCAAGAVLLDAQRVVHREQIDTLLCSGGNGLRESLVALVQRVRNNAVGQGYIPIALGIGIPELISPDGQVLSQATIPWQHWDLATQMAECTGLPTRIEADVRAAALAEALWGAGRSDPCFLYVTIGTGISASLVLHSQPFAGTRGLTGTFASGSLIVPDERGQLALTLPLEHYSSGPALARRFQALSPEFQGTARDVLSAAEAGNCDAAWVVESGGRAAGSAVAHLINMLDPNQVIVGGGLGLAPGRYRTALERGLRETVWSELHREIPLATAVLQHDAGWIGAALATQRPKRIHGMTQLESHPDGTLC